MARQNPQAKVLMETLANAGKDPNGGELDEEVLVLFNGPHHHYVTPKFYTATKPATGKVVPTWNYSAVQAYGRVRVFCDSKGEGSGSYLQKQIEDLTKLNEGLMGYGEKGTEKARWEVDDAPGNYIDIMKKNIIGVEIHVERLEGKFKMSQEMGTGDREGVVNGFEELGTDVGLGMAKTVKERGELKDQAARK